MSILQLGAVLAFAALCQARSPPYRPPKVVTKTGSASGGILHPHNVTKPAPEIKPVSSLPATLHEIQLACAKDEHLVHQDFLCCSGKAFSKHPGNLDGCCCKEAYSTLAQICCNGTLSDRTVGKHQLCCNGKAIDGIKYSCCSGIPQRRKPDTECCGNQSYYTTKNTCCGGQVTPFVKGHQCCGKNSFDPKTHLCCNGSVHPKVSKHTACCGAQTFNSGIQICCKGVRMNMSKYMYGCCGVAAYRLATEQCVYDPAFKAWKGMGKKSGKARCAARIYDIRSQQCALSNGTYAVSERSTMLLAMPKEIEKHDYKVRKQYRAAIHECPTLKADENLRDLVNSKVSKYCDVWSQCTVTPPKHGHVCCNGQYLPSWWSYSSSISRVYTPQCCGRDIIYQIMGRPNKYSICCGGKKYRGVNLKCCGSGVYDSKRQTCCSGKVIKGANKACCGKDSYDPIRSLCCPHGDEPYVIAKRSPSHTKCCHLLSYDKTKNSCCGFELTPITTGCCDGWNPYALRDNICCDYKLYSKLVEGRSVPTLKCCGSKTYDMAKGERCCNDKILIERTESSHSLDYWKWWWSHNMAKIRKGPKSFRKWMRKVKRQQKELAKELDKMNRAVREAMAEGAKGNYGSSGSSLEKENEANTGGTKSATGSNNSTEEEPKTVARNQTKSTSTETETPKPEDKEAKDLAAKRQKAEDTRKRWETYFDHVGWPKSMNRSSFHSYNHANGTVKDGNHPQNLTDLHKRWKHYGAAHGGMHIDSGKAPKTPDKEAKAEPKVKSPTSGSEALKTENSVTTSTANEKREGGKRKKSKRSKKFTFGADIHEILRDMKNDMDALTKVKSAPPPPPKGTKN